MVVVKELTAGAIILDADEPARVQRVCGPVPCNSHAWEVRLKRLRSHAVARVRRNPWQEVELVDLPERELHYLYKATVGYVLYDPATGTEYIVAEWLDAQALDVAEPGVLVLAGFWQGQPITFRKLQGTG